MGLVLRHLRPYAGPIALTLALVLLQALAELGLPTLMAGIIDQGVLGGQPEVILPLGLTMLAAASAGALASLAAAWFSARLSAAFGRDLRASVFRRATALAPDRYSAYGAASLITRTTNDVTQVQSFVVMALRMLAMAPLMAVGGLVMAFALDPGLAWVLGLSVPLLALVIVLVARRGVELFALVQTRLDRLNLVLRETLTGVRVLRAFDRDGFDQRRFDRANIDLAEVSVQTQRLMAAVWPGMMLAMSLTSLALVWFGADRVQVGALAVGGLMAFLQYATMILFSLMMMSMLFVILPRAAVSARRIAEVLGEPEPSAEGRTVPPATPGARIEFDHVTFRYPGAEAAALEDLSFTAEAGAFTALIGGTGAGKSTVLQLIARYHDATEGRVLVDGVDVRAWDRQALRQRLGIAFQKARLFSGTIAENLRWGRPEAGPDDLDAALTRAQARDFVAARPGGVEDPLDQAGANLSGGQRQRLAVARALIRRPAVLILDDSFSALDARTEAALRATLAARNDGSTLIAVGQRVASVQEADRIVVLDEGRLAGVGTHEELLAHCAVYREIAASQEASEVPHE